MGIIYRIIMQDNLTDFNESLTIDIKKS